MGTTDWSYILHEIKEIVNNTIPKYGIDDSPERYNEVLLKKIQITLEQNKYPSMSFRGPQCD